MAQENLERAVQAVLSSAGPLTCPACGATFGVDVETVDVELGEGGSLGSVAVDGRAGCTRCDATWRFRGAYRPYDFAIELD